MPTIQQKKLMDSIGERYGKDIGDVAERLGMSPEHIFNLIYTESSGNPDSVGAADDTGLTQITPDTAVLVAKQLGYKEYKSPEDLQAQLKADPRMNILFGAQYFKNALDAAPDDPVLAYSLYNAELDYKSKSAWHRGVFDQISARDLSGDNEISRHAATFLNNYSIMGYDPYAPQRQAPQPAQQQAPQQLLGEGMDQRMMPQMPEGGLAPRKRLQGYDPAFSGRVAVRSDMNPLKRAIVESPLVDMPQSAQDMQTVNVPARAMAHAAQSFSGGYAPVADYQNQIIGPPEGAGQKIAASAGDIGGMLPVVGGLGGGLAGFGAYGALHKAPNFVGHLKGGASNFALGAGLGMGGRALGAAANAINPTFGEAAGKFLGTRAGRMAADVPVFTGLELAHGVPLKDAALGGVGGALGAQFAGGGINRAPLEKSPARQESEQAIRLSREAEIQGIEAKYGVVESDRARGINAARARAQQRVAGVTDEQTQRWDQAASETRNAEEYRRAELAKKMETATREVEKQAAERAAKRRAEWNGGDEYLGSGVPQQAYEMAVDAVRSFGSKTKDVLIRNKEEWSAVKEGALADIPGARRANVFAKYLREDDMTLHDVAVDLFSVKDRVVDLSKLPTHDLKDETQLGLDRVEAAKSELRHDLDRELTDAIDAGEYKDVDPKRADLTDRARNIQNIGGNAQGSKIEQLVLRANQMADLAGIKMERREHEVVDDLFDRYGIERNSKDSEALGRLLENVTRLTDISQLVKKPDIREMLLETESPAAVVEAAIEARAWLDAGYKDMSYVGESVGGEHIGRVEGYFPKGAKKPSWYDFIEKFKRARENEAERVSGSVSNRGRVANTNRMHRKTTDPEKVMVGEMEVPRNWDAYDMLHQYATNKVASITGDVAMFDNLKIAKYLELSGAPGSADLIRKITAQGYNNELHGIGGALDQYFPATVRTILAMNKRAFDRAHYSGNPIFTGTRQWTSLLQVVARHPMAATQALTDLTNPDAVAAVNNTHAARIKRHDGSRLSKQADGSIIGMSQQNAAAKINKSLMDGMSSGMEQATVTYAGLVAARVGKAKGYTGKKLSQYISDQQGKTQSFYNFGDRAGLLNSRVFQGLFPAQSFGIETVNEFRESRGKTGVDTGYGTLRRAYDTGALIGATIAGQMITAKMAGYAVKTGKDAIESALSWLPMSGTGLGVGAGSAGALPGSQMWDVYYAIKYMSKGEYGMAYRYLARNWQPGGAFAGAVAADKLPPKLQELKDKAVEAMSDGGSRGGRQEAVRQDGAKRQEPSTRGTATRRQR